MNHFTKDKHYINMSIMLQMLIMTFEAESIAYTICQHYGLDSSDYSFSYVAGWSSGKEVKELKASLERIRSAAKLEGKYVIRDEPPPHGKDCNDYLQHLQRQKHSRQMVRE